MEEWDEPQPTEAAALALLASERALSACCKRTAILRATTLVGGQSNGLQSILSDAMGLKGTLGGVSRRAACEDGAGERSERGGGGGRGRFRRLRAADARWPTSGAAHTRGRPWSCERVRAALGTRRLLPRVLATCHAAAVFDSIAEQKGWPELRLRGPAEVQPAADEDDSTDGPNTPVFSTRKLRKAGYELVWPDVCTPPSPEDSESASADCGPAGADTESADPTRRVAGRWHSRCGSERPWATALAR